MDDGFYWYFPSQDDEGHWCGELRPDSDPAVYQIYENRIQVSDISVHLDEAHGKLVGPLQPPADPR